MEIYYMRLQKKNSDINFVGIEVYKHGVGKLLKKIIQTNIKNINVINDDANEILEKNIEDNSVKGISIFFPDPWPKKKHKKRRLINEEFVKNLDKITLKYSEILIATDDEDYSNQILKSFSKLNLFKLLLKTSDNQIFEDYKIYPTKYFRKAKRENRRINLFIYQK